MSQENSRSLSEQSENIILAPPDRRPGCLEAAAGALLLGRDFQHYRFDNGRIEVFKETAKPPVFGIMFEDACPDVVHVVKGLLRPNETDESLMAQTMLLQAHIMHAGIALEPNMLPNYQRLRQ